MTDFAAFGEDADLPPVEEWIEEERGQSIDGRRISVRYRKVGDVISDWETIVRDRRGNVIPPPPPELPTDPLWCPDCQVTSPRGEWVETTVPCEDCGDHDALRCPACGEVHDTVHTNIGAPPEGDQP